MENVDFIDAVSPFRELAAYEALWDKKDTTVKKISDLFSQYFYESNADNYKKIFTIFKNNDFNFSSLVDEKVIGCYKEKLKPFIFKYNFNISMFFEPEFPCALLDSFLPIYLLYYMGNFALLNKKAISVVGTRMPTEEGVRRTEKLVRKLCEDEYVIVSGLARGIDTAAHKTAIATNGSTIAVIGTPINKCYPPENTKLQQEIAKEHLLISQVPFLKYESQDFRKNRFFFPERNKIMSSISEATIIVEAGETSGSLIQARDALKKGKKVFILNSCFENKAITWPERLNNLGAIRVREYEEIKQELNKNNG